MYCVQVDFPIKRETRDNATYLSCNRWSWNVINTRCGFLIKWAASRKIILKYAHIAGIIAFCHHVLGERQASSGFYQQIKNIIIKNKNNHEIFLNKTNKQNLTLPGGK